MQRRAFLVTAAGVSVAGCSGSSDDNQSGAVAGESLAAGAGVELEVQEVILTHELRTEEGEIYIPESGNLFLFLRIESRNSGEEIVDLAGRDELRLVYDQEQFEPLVSNIELSDPAISEYEEPMSGELYQTVEDARPDITSSGILAFEIPVGSEEARLTWAREYEQDEPLYWTLSLNPDSVPQFQIEEVRTPERAEYYSDFELEVEVTNNGPEGAFTRNITVQPAGDQYQIREQIPGNETVTVTKTIAYPARDLELIDDATISMPFHEASVPFGTPTRNVGEFYTGPAGLRVSVTDYEETDRAVRNGGFEDEVVYEADSGERLLFVEFTIENTDDESRQIPRNSNVFIETTDGESFELEVRHPTAFSGDERFTDPIQGGVITQNSLEPGESIAGWTLYAATESIDLDNAYLKWVRGGFVSSKFHRLQARWSL